MNNFFAGITGTNEVLSGLILLVSFLLGSIPFGLFVARVFKVKDLPQRGSGNIGATNVSRVVGFWPAGFITFLLDVIKGALAVLLAMPMGSRALAMILGIGSEANPVEVGQTLSWAAGFFSVLGHCYSPWLHFKGGKGVATGLGVVLVLSPISALFGLVGFALTFMHRRIASLSSIAGLILTATAYMVLNPVGVHLWVGAAMLFLVLIRHEANIDALLENREKSFR